LVRVTSAEEMYSASHQYYGDVDVAICAAAVADYKPKVVADQKIKKSEDEFAIELEKTKDILASLGKIKQKQYLIGFALETENEIENAKLKIQKKNLDLIVLNSLQDKGAGFATATNKVTFIDKDFVIEPMPLKSKEAVAEDIMTKVITHYEKNS
jgi:phosphopantothenoylcysteine decarboxylase/phosphopantothenate--cysteine ligase